MSSFFCMRFLFIFIFCGIGFLAQAQFPAHSLQSGDLVFLDLDCGPLCEAIEAVTTGYQGNKFSHMGLVYRKADSIWVIEAIGKAVCLTPLATFLAYSPKPAMVSRLVSKHRRLTKKAVAYALTQIGQPYDDDFLPANGKWYCSELIQEAFYVANGRKVVFPTEPMTFKMPGSDQFFPVWQHYFTERGQAVPEGIPGCNPGGLSRSPYAKMMGWLVLSKSTSPNLKKD